MNPLPEIGDLSLPASAREAVRETTGQYRKIDERLARKSVWRKLAEAGAGKLAALIGVALVSLAGMVFGAGIMFGACQAAKAAAPVVVAHDASPEAHPVLVKRLSAVEESQRADRERARYIEGKIDALLTAHGIEPGKVKAAK